MQKVVHRASERGVAEHGWLHSRFSFSFADWHEPTRMGFGALRVINDDTIDAHSGFPMHPHRDMEIITIVNEGTVSHEDSMGTRGTVGAGEVQVMSAGTGVVHSEMNVRDDALTLFQIWIYSDRPGHVPRYAQASFPKPELNVPQLLVGPWESGAPLTIHQEARIVRVRGTEPYTHTLLSPRHGLYTLVCTGQVAQEGEELYARDALGTWGGTSTTMTPHGEADVLCIEVPVE